MIAVYQPKPRSRGDQVNVTSQYSGALGLSGAIWNRRASTHNHAADLYPEIAQGLIPQGISLASRSKKQLAKGSTFGYINRHKESEGALGCVLVNKA